jgi:tellurite methyltransferase
MTDLPFEGKSFDYILSWNVIYHGNSEVVARTISEIYRVLRPGGLLQLTMLTDRNSEMETGQCISEGTYINPGFLDKDHPHYYCNAKKLAERLNDFRMVEQVEKEHTRPGSFHWHLLLEKQPATG